MVPKDLIGYFATSATIAGALIGLLFVSISLRYDAVLGRSADFGSRATADAAFTALVNALTISLLALIPDSILGYAAVVSALVCLYRTLRLHVGNLRRIDRSLGRFFLSLAVYLSQLGNGAFLIARPHSATAVSVIAYTLFGSLATALSRSWQLLQPHRGDAATATPAAVSQPAGAPD